MSMVSSNRLLPLLVGIVMVLTLFVILKSCSDGSDNPLVLGAVPQAPKPDADTPADTINTLTANVSAMTTAVSALRQDNAALQQENQRLLQDRDQIENNVLSRLQHTLRTTTQENDQQRERSAQREASIIAELTARVDTLSQSLQGNHRSQSRSSVDVPVGLGLDGVNPSLQDSEALIWTDSLEHSLVPSVKEGGLLNRLGRSTHDVLDSAKPEAKRLVTRSAQIINPVTPVYTIPRNATLIGSTAMTALVGRVPVQGQVRDPMPFKVIVGKDNLAANGLTIPGVQGMIWSGTAIGDWTLSCVSGQLESVTFVFEDGTIQTLSSDDRNTSVSSGQQSKPLGWISDARGIPCISGARKTNAPAFLTQRLAVVAMDAAAQAAAQTETTASISDAGVASSTVTGDTGQYVLGKTLSGGSQEVAQWLRERQAQSFDAVFVPAGVELAIHVDHELPIDYYTNGRKLDHAHSLDRKTHPQTVSGLD